MKIRKIISLLFCFLLVLTFVGCGNEPAENKPATNNEIIKAPIKYYNSQFISASFEKDNFGKAKVISSLEQLEDFLLEHKEDKKLSNALKKYSKYDGYYFEDKMLVLAYRKLPSTSQIRIDSLSSGSDGKIYIDIKELKSIQDTTDLYVPWVVLIELEDNIALKGKEDVVISWKDIIITPYEFEARFIETHKKKDSVNIAEPSAKVIYSVNELKNYYEATKEFYDLERKERPENSANTEGFLDATDKYDEAYFEKNSLVVVKFEGSIYVSSKNYEINSFYKGSDGKLFIGILNNAEAAGEAHWEWHILIEAPKDLAVESDEDIIISRENK